MCGSVWESLCLRAGNVWFHLGESLLESRECVVLSGRVFACRQGMCGCVWESLFLRAGNVWFHLGEALLEWFHLNSLCCQLPGRVARSEAGEAHASGKVLLTSPLASCLDFKRWPPAFRACRVPWESVHGRGS